MKGTLGAAVLSQEIIIHFSDPPQLLALKEEQSAIFKIQLYISNTKSASEDE